MFHCSSFNKKPIYIYICIYIYIYIESSKKLISLHVEDVRFLFQSMANASHCGEYTPQKTNMDTQHDGLEKVAPFFKFGHFWYLLTMLNFSVIPDTFQKMTSDLKPPYSAMVLQLDRMNWLKRSRPVRQIGPKSLPRPFSETWLLGKVAGWFFHLPC